MREGKKSSWEKMSLDQINLIERRGWDMTIIFLCIDNFMRFEHSNPLIIIITIKDM